MALHCSPPANKLEHGLDVTGHGANIMMAIFDAFVKLSAEVPGVEAALTRDANLADCPRKCSKKTVGKPEFRGISFDIGFDARKADWHCTIGVAGAIEILCEQVEA